MLTKMDPEILLRKNTNNKKNVGDKQVLVGVSGGVDSSVVAA